MSPVLFAFLLTLMAGLFTGVGGLLPLITKKTSNAFLAVCLSFSAGVMIYVSFVEIFAKSAEMLVAWHGEDLGFLFTTLAFFAGMGLLVLLGKILPEEKFMPQMNDESSNSKNLPGVQKRCLQRIGLISAAAIAIHNFPEGFVTFAAALQDPSLGISIAAAISIHNIPEGIAIAVPIYYATGSKLKGLMLALLSGLAEPLGAISAYLMLARWMDDNVFGIAFAFVGGIMVYISMSHLLPTAQKYGKGETVIKGLFAGMGLMALSLVIF